MDRWQHCLCLSRALALLSVTEMHMDVNLLCKCGLFRDEHYFYASSRVDWEEALCCQLVSVSVNPSFVRSSVTNIVNVNVVF